MVKHIHFSITEYIMMIIGTVLVGIAYVLFFIPNNIAPGGIGGLSVILSSLIPLRVGTLTFLMNIPIFVFALMKLGRQFVIRTLLLLMLMTSIINFLPLSVDLDDRFMSVVCGGLLMGIGLGLVINTGSSTGGTDTLAVTLNKLHPDIRTGEILFALDAVVVVSAGIVFDIETAVYSAVAVLIETVLLDYVRDGFNQSKAAFIITSKPLEVKQSLFDETQRGVTELIARGGFTNREITVLLCIVSKRQLALVKKCVKNTDSASFVFCMNTSEVIGKGFSRFE